MYLLIRLRCFEGEVSEQVYKLSCFTPISG